MLIPHNYHDRRMERELEKQLKEKWDFNPGEFLQEMILDNISSVEVLVYGNTLKEDSIEFCKREIVPKFKISDNLCFHDGVATRCGIRAGCIYSEKTTSPKKKHKKLGEMAIAKSFSHY